MKVIEFLKRIRCMVIVKISKGKIVLGKSSTFGRGTVLYAPTGINIDDNVYIGKYCCLETDIEIGKNVLIGNNVGLIGKYDHDYSKVGMFIKDSPWIGDSVYSFKGKGLKIVIDEDTWIGYGSIILSGVKIGRGTIIAAGSVVTRNIPEYSIAGGNPCKVIKTRFTEREIREHENKIRGCINENWYINK